MESEATSARLCTSCNIEPWSLQRCTHGLKPGSGVVVSYFGKCTLTSVHRKDWRETGGRPARSLLLQLKDAAIWEGQRLWKYRRGLGRDSKRTHRTWVGCVEWERRKDLGSPWTLSGTTWWVVMLFTKTGNPKGGVETGWEGWREVRGGDEKLWKALCPLSLKKLWASHVVMVPWGQSWELPTSQNFAVLWTWQKLRTCTLILHRILGKSQTPGP